MVLIGSIIVIVVMVALCYITAGNSIIAGSIFEHKTTVGKKK